MLARLASNARAIKAEYVCVVRRWYWQVTGLGPEQTEFLHVRFGWEKKTCNKCHHTEGRECCEAGKAGAVVLTIQMQDLGEAAVKRIPSQTNHLNKHPTRAQHCTKRFNEAAQIIAAIPKESRRTISRVVLVWEECRGDWLLLRRLKLRRRNFESRIDRRYWKTVQENLPNALHCAGNTWPDPYLI